MEFPLSRAPEMFFDEQLWQIFVSYFETPEIALERIGSLSRSTFVQAGDQIYWFAAVFGLRALYTAAKPVADNKQNIDRPDGPMTAAANSHQLRDAIR